MLPEHHFKDYDGKQHETVRLDSLYRNIKHGDTVIEVGAEHFDTSALLAKWCGADLGGGIGGGIALIEPSPFVWANGRAIWEANRFRNPMAYFVGFAGAKNICNPPKLNIDQRDAGGWPACAYGKVTDHHGFRHMNEESDATPTISLDYFCGKFDLKPDIINIDVEGSELYVLLGAKNILRAYKPLVYVSVHRVFMTEMYGYDAPDLQYTMDIEGYKCTTLAVDHEEHWLFYHPQGRIPNF